MALKALRLRKKIELKTTELNSLREKDKDFETREAELTRSIEEADTEEDQALVDDEIEKFTREKEEHEEAEKNLEDEIRELEQELEEVEKEPPAPQPEDERDKRGGVRNMQIRANIRELPMNVRAFDALTREERTAIVETDEVQQFLSEIRAMGKSKRAISGADLTIPIVFLDLISENMFRYSKLMNRVRVRNVSGEARQTIAGTIPEAVWTEMCGAINELTFRFNQLTVDGYKVAGYISVCNSTLEDSDVDLAGTIVEMISEAMGLAKDKA
ncbi:MAG: phage major capsid protein, partial [Anaerovoracaceae bacterium]